MRTVMEVLQELRIDLQDFAWLIAQQLRIDNALVQASDQVYFIKIMLIYLFCLLFELIHCFFFLFFFLQLVVVFSRGRSGRKRSLIRQIASRLPLEPLPRIHFTIVNPEYAASYDWDGRSTVDEGLAAIPVLDNEGKIDFWR